MKLTTIAVLLYLFLGLASAPVSAQTFNPWSCGAYPVDYQCSVQCSGDQEGSDTSADAFSAGHCSNNKEINTLSYATATQFSGGGASSYTAAVKLTNYTPHASRATARGWAWFPTQTRTATADMKCDGDDLISSDSPASLSNTSAYASATIYP